MLAGVAQIEVDVVILGGGIQGLWLLADLLDQGYQALVLERAQLGCGQTGHAHVFLHQGHMHASRLKGEELANAATRIKPFREAHRIWMHELSHGRLQAVKKRESRFYIGFGNHTEAMQFEKACKNGQIDSKTLNNPPTLFPISYWTHEANGVSLESQAVMSSFLGHQNLGSRVVTAEKVEFQDQGSNGFCVVVKEPNPELEILCHGLVLTAGAGNEQLIREVGTIRVDLSSARQQTVKTYMLVVKTPVKDLEPACGFFPIASNIFLAHRLGTDGSIIWLVGDRQRNPVNVPGEWTALDARSWFRKLWPDLKRLMPRLLIDRQHCEWGIYEAAKAEPWRNSRRYPEGGAPPEHHRVFKDRQHNVWAVWPSFLTLAPVVAKEVSDAIAAAGIPKSKGNSRVPGAPGGQGGPEPDRWQTTPLLDWATFERCYA